MKNSNHAIKKTYQEIATFDGEARGWLAKNTENTKFSWAIKRVLKRTQAALQEYREKAEDITIEHCSVDGAGNIIIEEGRDPLGRPMERYKFTKEALQKRNDEQRTLFKKQVDIEPYVATDLPKDLSEEDKELFMDFVLKEPSGQTSEEKPTIK